MRRWLWLALAWLLLPGAFSLAAQAPVPVVFVWDVDDPGWPGATAAQISRDGFTQDCGPLEAVTATTYRCAMSQAPGRATFQVRGVNVPEGLFGFWSFATTLTVEAVDTAPGQATVVQVLRLAPEPDPGGGGSVAFTNVGSAEAIFAGSSATTDTASAVAVPDLGANRVGVVIVNHASGNVAVTGVTWNGSAMTAGESAASTNQRVYIYYLVGAADNGNYDIAVTYASSVIHSVQVVIAWADNAGAFSLTDTSTATGTGDNITIDTTPSSANAGIMFSGSASASNTLSGISTGTSLQDYDQGGNTSQAAYSLTTGSGTQTHAHDYTDAGSNYAIAAILLQEDSGGASAAGPLVGGKLVGHGVLLGRLVR